MEKRFNITGSCIPEMRKSLYQVLTKEKTVTLNKQSKKEAMRFSRQKPKQSKDKESNKKTARYTARY